MTDRPKLLVVGALTPRMQARLSEVFEVCTPSAEDRDAFLAAEGPGSAMPFWSGTPGWMAVLWTKCRT